MSKQGPTGKRINITSTIQQKLEIIRRLTSGGGGEEGMAPYDES
jgi:hypothetical protein